MNSNKEEPNNDLEVLRINKQIFTVIGVMNLAFAISSISHMDIGFMLIIYLAVTYFCLKEDIKTDNRIKELKEKYNE